MAATLIDDGTAGAPGLAFTNDTNTGLFRPGADILAFSAGGTERARLDSTGLTLAGTLTVNGVFTLTGHVGVG